MKSVIKLVLAMMLVASCASNEQVKMVIETSGNATLSVESKAGTYVLESYSSMFPKYDTVMVFKNEKIKYSYSVNSGEFQVKFYNPSYDGMLHENHSNQGKSSGKFRFN